MIELSIGLNKVWKVSLAQMFSGPHLKSEVASALAESGAGCAQHANMQGLFGIYVHFLQCSKNVESLGAGRSKNLCQVQQPAARQL